jgi:hypothetical protein
MPPRGIVEKSTPNVVEQRQWRREIVRKDNRESLRRHGARAELICSPQVHALVRRDCVFESHGGGPFRGIAGLAHGGAGFRPSVGAE